MISHRSGNDLIGGIRQLISADDGAFVDSVRSLIGNLDPNGVIQVMVAYKNLTPILRACKHSFIKATPEEIAGMKYRLDTIEGFIEFTCDDYESHSGPFGVFKGLKRWGLANLNTGLDATKRRDLWFAHAAFLMRANSIAENREQYQDATADIWIHIIENGTVFKGALQHNILWSDDETDWFRTKDIWLDDKGGREFCARTTPRYLLKNAKMRNYLNSIGMGDAVGDWLWFQDRQG